MHDIWNPWHGCVKCSEGCANCYMFFLDGQRGGNGAEIYKTKAGFSYPLAKTRAGAYKVRPGELIRVCMTSDFFLPQADAWRPDAWDIMRQRPDVRFFILTKRPERAAACLPPDWGRGWPNVMLNVSAENNARAQERLAILEQLPAAHKGVMCAPLLGPVDLEPWLARGVIEQVICGGENYAGARPCNFSWVEALSNQCRAEDVTFAFIETGTVFVKDGKTYRLQGKQLQSEQAFKSGLSHRGRPIEWHLTDPIGLEIPPDQLYQPEYGPRCQACAGRLICNGCAKKHGCTGCNTTPATRK